MPVGLVGLVLAGLLAAFMSTFDSTVNSGAAYLVNDVYKRYINKVATARKEIVVSYAASLGVVVLGVVPATGSHAHKHGKRRDRYDPAVGDGRIRQRLHRSQRVEMVLVATERHWLFCRHDVGNVAGDPAAGTGRFAVPVSTVGTVVRVSVHPGRQFRLHDRCQLDDSTGRRRDVEVFLSFGAPLGVLETGL